MDKKSKFYWIYLIAFFVILTLPLLTVPPWFHPAAWGKTIVFRIIISVLVFVFIWQILSKKIDNKVQAALKNVLDRKNKVFWPFWLLVALWGIFLLATIFSLDPYYSFWGSPYRAGGFLNFSFYIFFAIFAFLLLNARDWEKIWKFSFGVGFLVSAFAIFQQFKIFESHIIPYPIRPPATMGSPIFLASYLILLVFLVLVFAIKEKNLLKRIFYFSTFILFLFIILLTGARSAYLGVGIGILYFFFFYPKKKPWLRIAAGVFLILVVLGIYYLNTLPEIPYVQKNPTLSSLLERFTIRLFLTDPRFSGWQILLESLKEKPILGYGPENISIAFDKYYDPSLPYISKEGGAWWDRAHNFILDIAVTAGIPALIIYLSFFIVLFWRLQGLKHDTNKSIIAHGIQATFLAYLATNFFSFDTFSTYLILFLLIAYSLNLIAQPKEYLLGRIISDRLYQYRQIIISILFIGLILFVWSFNIRPLLLNKELNLANYYLEDKEKGCETALAKIEKLFPSHSFISFYIRIFYIDIIGRCVKENPSQREELAKKAIPTLKESVKMRPYYTKAWLLLAGYTNMLVENSKNLTLEDKKNLVAESYSYLEKAQGLSPKRQEVFFEWTNWIDSAIDAQEYQKAKEKAEEFISLNLELASSWWQKALINIYLNNLKEAKENIETASQKGYTVNTPDSLPQLLKAYVKLLESSKDIELYKALSDTYQKLITYEPENFQYHASLAYVYKMLGEYEKAREEAEIVLKLSPESKSNVEEFLRTL